MASDRIYYRGISVKNDDWYYGDLVHISGHTFINDDKIGQMVRVYPYTVGVSTGFKIRGGHYLYEGDIFEWRGRRYEVESDWRFYSIKFKTIDSGEYNEQLLMFCDDGSSKLEMVKIGDRYRGEYKTREYRTVLNATNVDVIDHRKIFGEDDYIGMINEFGEKYVKPEFKSDFLKNTLRYYNDMMNMKGGK